MKDHAQSAVEYPDTGLLVAGRWRAAEGGDTLPVHDPATGHEIGRVAVASGADLTAAVKAATEGLAHWRQTAPLVRSGVLRQAAALLRQRAGAIAPVMSLEQGKPLAEAMAEIAASAELLEWFAEEARRTYGRVIPARAPGALALLLKEPVGIVAAFTPWNFPISQAARKLGAALAAGCAVIIKPPEETPASPAALVQALVDAGLPPGVVNVVYGVPADISDALITDPQVRKVSFTGSTAVGKQLAARAGAHMKRITMELGGHAPAIVMRDADLDRAADVLFATKFRNAGQVCIAPTRFLIEDAVHDAFVARMQDRMKGIRVGHGLAPDSTMGSLANPRRLEAMEMLVADAEGRGARRLAGGHRIGNTGSFFAPTLLADMPTDARAMNEEPFGPIVLVRRVSGLDEVLAEANRLPFGLAAYAFTGSTATAVALRDGIEAGMISINHYGLAFAEMPFGGVKDSGYGSEGGVEAVEAYLAPKFVSQTG